MRSNEKIVYWGAFGLLVFIFIWFLPWRFDSNDDVIMMWLVSGAYTGSPESYAVFIHPILSWIFSNLYTVFPLIQWYSIAWYLTLYSSFLGVLICVVNSSFSSSWKKLLMLSLLILWIHFSFFLQFTIVAGVAGFSGFLLFEKSTQLSAKIYRIFALALISLSILIRWESFVLFALGFGLNQILSSTWIDLATKVKKYSLIIFIFLGLFFSDYLYVNNSQYAEFKDYTKARASVFDHPAFYTLVKERRLDLKSEWFFFSQSMMDGNAIDIEKLTELKDQLDDELYTLYQIRKSFTRLKELLVFQNFKIAISLVIVVFYFWVFWGKTKRILFCILWMSFMLVFNHFFIVNPRVYILFFLALFFPILEYPGIPRVKPLILAFIHFILGAFLLIHLNNISKEAKRRKLIAEQFEDGTIGLNKNQLIVFEGFQQNFLPTHYNMINPVPYLSMGWISKSPFQEKALNRFGVNIMTDSKEFYLFGFEENDEYHFPEYMTFLGYNYQLESCNSSDELVLFHYTKKK